MAFRASIVVFLVFFGIAALLAWHSGAFQAEFGDAPDEPAHYITGLMMRDYIARGFPGPPLAFARNYYVHYPKVALGHWPPFFYIVQSAWTLVFGPSRASLVLLMSGLTALVAVFLWNATRQEFGFGGGILSAGLWLTLPIVEQFSRDVMGEILLSALVLLAVLAYGNYLDTERWQPAAWFGLWFSLAMLTKGSAVELAFLPPLAVLYTRRWKLLERFSFWLPAIMVGVLAGPWYLWVPGAQHESVKRFGGISFLFPRLVSSLTAWGEMLGLVLAAAAVLGICVSVRRESAGKWISGLSVLLGAYLARFVIGAFEDRQLIVNLPILVMFAVAGGYFVLRRRWQVPFGIALILIGFHVYISPAKAHSGYSEVAASLLSRPEFSKSAILICSDPEGEGMLISEVAMRESRPGHYVLRASKMLASSEWMGWEYQPLYSDANAMLDSLERIPVGVVVMDGKSQASPHGRMLVAGLEARPEKWQPVTSPVTGIRIYRLVGQENRPPGRIEIPMKSGLFGKFSNE